MGTGDLVLVSPAQAVRPGDLAWLQIPQGGTEAVHWVLRADDEGFETVCWLQDRNATPFPAAGRQPRGDRGRIVAVGSRTTDGIELFTPNLGGLPGGGGERAAEGTFPPRADEHDSDAMAAALPRTFPHESDEPAA